MRDGFVLLDAAGAVEREIPADAQEPRRRMNDGRCDPSGRFWAGTMDTEFRRADGQLFRLNGSSASVAADGLRLSNGLGWSPDARTMYLVDTLAAVIWRAPFDVAAGAMGAREPLCEVPDAWGKADGLCVGADGDVWIACYGAGAVRRLSPDGALRDTHALPVSRPTCPCLSPDGTLYVTTAQGDAGTAPEPGAGAIFALAVDAPGLPTTRFAG